MPSIIVFSKDRPMQLYAYLESLFLFSDVTAGQVSILYRGNSEIDYSKVIASFPDLNWVKENDFHFDLVSLIHSANDYVMFGCDDVVFTGLFSINYAEKILSGNKDIFGFSFRLGTNIEPQPKIISKKYNYLEWNWQTTKEPHYSYPWELMGTLYRKSDIDNMIKIFGEYIKSPNYFEGNFAQAPQNFISRPNLACLNEKGKLIGITVNKVQHTHPNEFDNKRKTDIDSLNSLYNHDNNMLDIEMISKIDNTTIHVGSEFFILKNYDKKWESFKNKKPIKIKKVNRLKLLVKNIGYLMRFDIKKIARESVSKEELNTALDGFAYEFDATQLLKPKIKNSEETISTLMDKRISFCRFGDGEFCLIKGEDIPYQKANQKLSQRLIEILKSDTNEILVGIPHFYFSSLRDLREYPKIFARTWVASNRNFITSLINFDKQYYDTACSQLYALYEIYDFKSYFNKIKELWRGRDIAIICGETVFSSIKNNIFDCAKSVMYQYAPRLNAFENYNELFLNAQQIDRNKLVIIILGPTATVLAYDLARIGYQAVDLGHLAKDYDFYIRNVEHTAQTISNFIEPD